MTTATRHTEISHRLITQAEEEFQKGDSLQASEKAWGAAAHALKSIAKQREWRQGTHRDLYGVVRSIESETSVQGVRRLFQVASELHSNFYEDRMPDEILRESIDDVKELIDRLEPLLPGIFQEQ